MTKYLDTTFVLCSGGEIVGTGDTPTAALHFLEKESFLFEVRATVYSSDLDSMLITYASVKAYTLFDDLLLEMVDNFNDYCVKQKYEAVIKERILEILEIA